jgi:hypothetical protein
MEPKRWKGNSERSLIFSQIVLIRQILRIKKISKICKISESYKKNAEKFQRFQCFFNGLLRYFIPRNVGLE